VSIYRAISFIFKFNLAHVFLRKNLKIDLKHEVCIPGLWTVQFLDPAFIIEMVGGNIKAAK
jgi:hypothetical protein